MANHCAEGIWFLYVRGNTIYYAIQGESERHSAAFDDMDACDAFDLWSRRYVSLSKELDDFAYFYVPKSEKQPYSDLVVVQQNSKTPGLDDFWTEVEIDDAVRGVAPTGWKRISGRTARRYLAFTYSC